MKRYWLFGGDDYYASGGMTDLGGSYDHVSEATAEATIARSKYAAKYEWWHVFDSEAFEIVAHSEYGPRFEDVPVSISENCIIVGES